MPVGLIQLVPVVTTPLALAAFIGVVFAWLAYKKLRNVLALIKTASPRDRIKVLNALISHFDINNQALTADQNFALATAQIYLTRHRERLCFYGLCLILFSITSAYTIGRIYPDVPQPTQAEASAAPALSQPKSEEPSAKEAVPVSAGNAGKQSTRLPFDIRLVNPATLEDELISDKEVTVSDSVNPIPNRVPRESKRKKPKERRYTYSLAKEV